MEHGSRVAVNGGGIAETIDAVVRVVISSLTRDTVRGKVGSRANERDLASVTEGWGEVSDHLAKVRREIVVDPCPPGLLRFELPKELQPPAKRFL
jgi:hypothetical protein